MRLDGTAGGEQGDIDASSGPVVLWPLHGPLRGPRGFRCVVSIISMVTFLLGLSAGGVAADAPPAPLAQRPCLQRPVVGELRSVGLSAVGLSCSVAEELALNCSALSFGRHGSCRHAGVDCGSSIDVAHAVSDEICSAPAGQLGYATIVWRRAAGSILLPSLPRTACTPPRGPGRGWTSSYNLRVSGLACTPGRLLAAACSRISFGKAGHCEALGDRWRCTSSVNFEYAGSEELCWSGRRSMSITWGA